MPLSFQGLADELGLTCVFPSPFAQWGLQPSIETAGSDAQAATHRAHVELLAMLGYERVSHLASLAKYAVAFFDVALLGDARQLLLQITYLCRLISIASRWPRELLLPRVERVWAHAQLQPQAGLLTMMRSAISKKIFHGVVQPHLKELSARFGNTSLVVQMVGRAAITVAYEI